MNQNSNINKEEKEKIDRLRPGAEAIASMLKKYLTVKNSLDHLSALYFASGLAGYSCHQAVKACNGNFVVIETKNGKKYFFGDDVNKYLLEDKLSVLSFMNGVYVYMSTDKRFPDINKIIQDTVSVIGNADYKIWNAYTPEETFRDISSLWKVLYDTKVSKICSEPSEWPIVYALVLQDIMHDVMEREHPILVFVMAMQCALYISKMDVESL